MAFPPRIAAGSKRTTLKFKADHSGSGGSKEANRFHDNKRPPTDEAALTPDDGNGVALWAHPHCVQMAPWSFV